VDGTISLVVRGTCPKWNKSGRRKSASTGKLDSFLCSITVTANAHGRQTPASAAFRGGLTVVISKELLGLSALNQGYVSGPLVLSLPASYTEQLLGPLIL
jgi:hypothetical protein